MAKMSGPSPRQSLSDDLVLRIQQLIDTGAYAVGDRLPSIMEMSRRFGVGHPTLREALKKLETLGIVDIRHGSGVYVGKKGETLLVSNPIYAGSVSKKLLIDLIEARIPIETQSAALAAVNATEAHLAQMRRLLARAEANLQYDEVLSVTNMEFHRTIAEASGNTVLGQLLEVLGSLFQREQRIILDIYGSRQRDHEEHAAILAALESRDEAMVVERMRAHLEGVREVLCRWDPQTDPVPQG